MSKTRAGKSRGDRFITTMAMCLVVVVLCQVGCGGAGGGVGAGRPDSLTGGASISMFITDGNQSHAYYELKPDGRLGFGGGHPAVRRETTWTGALNEKEAARLRDLLESNGWYMDRPLPDGTDSTGAEDHRRHDVRFAWPGGAWRYSERVGSSRIAPIRTYLAEITTRKRHGDLLDRLPEPGPRTR